MELYRRCGHKRARRLDLLDIVAGKEADLTTVANFPPAGFVFVDNLENKRL